MHEKMNEALDEIRDEYIEKAANVKKKPRWGWMGAVAAVLAVVILVGTVVRPGVTDPSGTGENLPPVVEGIVGGVTLRNMTIRMADYNRYAKPQYEAVRQLSEQLQGFSAESITRILSGSNGENQAFSPINLYMALAMTAELTGGNGQILELLNTDNLEDLRSQANLVWNTCYRDEGDKTLLANSIWLRKDLDFDEATLDTLADNYFASSFAADFGTASTNAAIASWLDQQTGGLLKEHTANTNLSAETIFALYSTVYFRAMWTNEFHKERNTQGVFHGTVDAECTFMNKEKMEGVYYWGDDYGMVRLYLKDGSDLCLILPDEGKTVADVLAAGEWLRQIFEGGENRKAMKINLSLPKFDITSSGDLTGDLQAMGVTEIFDPGAGCFADFIQADTPSCISAVKQATRVAVDEEGITAASYVEMPNAGAAPPPDEIIDFILDRPFLFVIVNGYDLPLFAGVVNDLS